MSRGALVVLEGIDGSGTTTQAQLLCDHLRGLGRQVLLTREPTTGPVGRFLRQALIGELSDGEGNPALLEPEAMALLFSADRIDHLHREILPALAKGTIVVCDRYDLSGLIYQSETSPEGKASLPWLRTLNKHARRPELTVVLDVPADLAEERRKARAEKEELFEKSELQRRLASAYGQAKEYLPNDEIRILSATGSVAVVEAQVREALASCPEFAWIRPSGS